ncbi:MAG: beta-N-acetylhexosaminidase [Sphaerochaetaceae bacterium]
MDTSAFFATKASEQLIPAPMRIVDTDGAFTFGSDTGIVYQSGLASEARIAAADLATALGYASPLPVVERTHLRGSDTARIIIRLVPAWDDGHGAEAYLIETTTDAIVIEAMAPDGIWHGLQTIRQLILVSGASIPCFSCIDSPRFAWRGFMLDCSRHFFSVEFIKKMIDAASLHHLNRFHWHLVDDQGWRLPVPEYPRLTEIGAYRTDLRQSWDNTYGDFYRAEQIQEIVRYADERHVMVVPEIETPGHASALLAAYPELGCTGGPYQVEDRWGIFDDVMCVGNDKVLDVLDAVFRTTAQLFPGPYIHIGGDECPKVRWKECPKCNKRLLENHLATFDELQSWMTVQVVKLIQKYGRRAIGWDEVLEGTETLGLPKDVIVMSWRGLEGGIKASSMGHEVIMCPTTGGCYLDHKHLDDIDEPGNISVATVRDSYEADPIAPGMDETQARMVIGGQGNLWTEKVCFAKHAEYMFFPRLAALAEGLWTPRENKDFASFSRRIPALHRRLDALGFSYYKGALS